jgi:hypothetical protein
MIQEPAMLQKKPIFLTNKRKESKEKKNKSKIKINKGNLCIKTSKDAANSQFLSTIKYS